MSEQLKLALEKRQFLLSNARKIFKQYQELWDDYLLNKQINLIERLADGDVFEWGLLDQYKIRGVALREILHSFEGEFMETGFFRFSDADLLLVEYIVQSYLEHLHHHNTLNGLFD